ncbi:MAG: hypothetical protein EXS10_04665 [Phycisphaerales bacterium]|nr:hypothetical protein [Phycisphaerales bacterium]
MSLIQQLVTLHRVDNQFRALEGRLETARATLASQERQLDVLTKQTEGMRLQERQLKTTIHALEVEVSASLVRVEKLRNELNTSANEKAYKSILLELKHLEENKKKIDDQTIGEMQRLEELQKRIVEQLAKGAERQRFCDIAKSELKERRSEVGARLEELRSERDRAASTIPDAARKIFNATADSTDGEAMAAVSEVNRRQREYACSACNIEMPFEAVLRLTSDQNTIFQCRACGRILYLEDALRDTIVPAPAKK